MFTTVTEFVGAGRVFSPVHKICVEKPRLLLYNSVRALIEGVAVFLGDTKGMRTTKLKKVNCIKKIHG